MIFVKDVTLLASVERTGTGEEVYSSAVNSADWKEAIFFINATAIAADTTLQSKIQIQDPVSEAWVDLVSFTNITVKDTPEKKDITANIGKSMRVAYTITNEKTITFTVSAILKSV